MTFETSAWRRLRVTATATHNRESTGFALRSDGFHYTFDEPLPTQAATQGPVRLGGVVPSFGPLRASAPRHHDEHEGCPNLELLESAGDDER
jgi:hypothetical protein